MANFRQETVAFAGVVYRNYGTGPVYLANQEGTWGEDWPSFLANPASDFEYDDGYGSPKVATDLVLVFDNGSYATRHDYDGSEWWEYHPAMPPTLPPTATPPAVYGGNAYMWDSLGEMNTNNATPDWLNEEEEEAA